VGGLRLMPSRLAARCKVAAATDKTGYKTQGFIILALKFMVAYAIAGIAAALCTFSTDTPESTSRSR
jgi:hypothetical protein